MKRPAPSRPRYFSPGSAFADGIMVTANGAQPSVAGPADYFSGAVVVDPVRPTEQSQVSGGQVSSGHVTFAHGARSARHTHPLGQTLIVTSGTGWVQERARKSR